ncbi:MAG TPA: extracellular solute-binding protein [Candidatus Limnocylindria bacterium]|jgi:iron(III) transport system substrate-binding protein|nr:extracellular solute-binding protein [Candidatus Limnocylindria bacterium]
MTPELDRRRFLKLASATALVAACGGATTAPTPTPSVAAATATGTPKPTGRISVYSALNELTNNEFIKGFKVAVPGVEIDLVPLAAAAELQTRIRAEKASPKADIFIGGDSSFHDGLGKEGLLEPYTSPNASAIAKEAKDPNGNWTGFYFGIFGIITNTDRFNKEIGGPKPTSWDDLLDAKYRGKLVLGSPITTGGGYIFIATQVFRFGRDETKAMDYMKKFHANVAQYPGTSPQAIALVSQGQFVGAPNWAHDILSEKAKNPGIDLSIPKGTGYEIGGVSIVKGSKNLPAAKAFIDWVLTKEAGELNVRLSNRVSVRTDVAPAPGAPTLQSVELVNYDRDWASANKDRLVRAWQQAVGL